jgi:hypothetical protein
MRNTSRRGLAGSAGADDPRLDQFLDFAVSFTEIQQYFFFYIIIFFFSGGLILGFMMSVLTAFLFICIPIITVQFSMAWAKIKFLSNHRKNLISAHDTYPLCALFTVDMVVPLVAGIGLNRWNFG